MIIKDNKFSKDKVFFAEEIIFDYSNDKISQNEIDEIEDFPGKDDFIHFYSIYNLNSALNYNEEGTGTFILNALKIAL